MRRINGKFRELDRQIRHLYVMRCGEYVKVGFAKDTRRRLEEVQAGNPLVVTVAFKRSAPASVILIAERHAHAALRVSHVHREWFKATVEEAAAAVVAGIAHAKEQAISTRHRLNRIEAQEGLKRRMAMGLNY